jgi:hypothetical protein
VYLAIASSDGLARFQIAQRLGVADHWISSSVDALIKAGRIEECADRVVESAIGQALRGTRRHLEVDVTAAVPPLVERQQPGLSDTLHHFPDPQYCQACGSPDCLSKWRECDPFDKPTMVVVVLCDRCSKKLIDPHPRLYIALQQHEPFPGVMQICIDCPMRRGVSCYSPLAKHNGGTGMRIDGARAFGGFFCGSKKIAGYHRMWTASATDCDGKKDALRPRLVE